MQEWAIGQLKNHSTTRHKAQSYSGDCDGSRCGLTFQPPARRSRSSWLCRAPICRKWKLKARGRFRGRAGASGHSSKEGSMRRRAALSRVITRAASEGHGVHPKAPAHALLAERPTQKPRHCRKSRWHKPPPAKGPRRHWSQDGTGKRAAQAHRRQGGGAERPWKQRG